MTTDQSIEKIDSILQKMELQDQVETWQIIGDKIHQRIADNQKQLADLKNKLHKKDGEPKSTL